MIGFCAKAVPPTSTGTLPKVDTPVRAVVVGGGLAGTAAAAILAERGVAVTLVEREAYLGGRVGAWTERMSDGESFEMERGFHAFFRQYYNLRAFLRRIDPDLRHLTPLTDYPLLGPDGASESFTGLPHLPPFNVIDLVRRTPRLRLPDLVKVNVGAAMEMLVYDPERTYEKFDGMSARDYLDSLNFPPDARLMLFNVFAHSFFNPEETMSAADLLMMFHFYFMGNPEGLVFDVLDEPFSLALWHPMGRHLEGLGVRVKLEQSATLVARGRDGGFRVHLEGTKKPLPADLLVLAVEAPALKTLVAASPDLDDPAWRASVESLDVTLPFAVWRIWLDRPVHRSRGPFVGTAGLGLLDNVSVYERLEGESRRWAMRTGGSVVELHGYAVPEDADEASIRRDLWTNLEAIYPEVKEAKVVEERFLLRRDCPAFEIGGHRSRPVVETPIKDLALAGDFVGLPFPSALMERAVASGVMAANQLLASRNVRGAEVWSVPQRGILAGVAGQIL